MVDEYPKRKLDMIDLANIEKFRQELRGLGSKTKVFDRLVRILCDNNDPRYDITMDLLLHFDCHFYPNIKDLMRASGFIMTKSMYNEVNKKSS
jgi:hypothetical protein